jgi:hypothetical protein
MKQSQTQHFFVSKVHKVTSCFSPGPSAGKTNTQYAKESNIKIKETILLYE